MIATPEYNYHWSAELKKFIEMLKKFNPNPFFEKPVAITSVTASPAGGVYS